MWCVQKHRVPGVIRRRSRFSRPPCRTDFRHRRMPPSDSWLFVVCLAALTAAAPSDKSTVCTLVATPAIFSGECAGGSARCGVLEVLPISEVRCALRGLRGGSYEQRIVRDSDSNCADNLHDSSPELFADAVEFVRAAAGENDCLHDEELARRLQEEENLRAAIISPHRRLSTERVSIDSPPYTVPRGLLGLGRAIISGAGRVLGMGPGAQRAALSERGLFDSGDELLGADRSAGQIASRRRAAVLADWVRRSEGGGQSPATQGFGQGRAGGRSQRQTRRSHAGCRFSQRQRAQAPQSAPRLPPPRPHHGRGAGGAGAGDHRGAGAHGGPRTRRRPRGRRRTARRDGRGLPRASARPDGCRPRRRAEGAQSPSQVAGPAAPPWRAAAVCLRPARACRRGCMRETVRLGRAPRCGASRTSLMRSCLRSKSAWALCPSASLSLSSSRDCCVVLCPTSASARSAPHVLQTRLAIASVSSSPSVARGTRAENPGPLGAAARAGARQKRRSLPSPPCASRACARGRVAQRAKTHRHAAVRTAASARKSTRCAPPLLASGLSTRFMTSLSIGTTPPRRVAGRRAGPPN